MSYEVAQVGPEELSYLVPKYLQADLPMLITGAPGVGKSDICAQAVKSLGWDSLIIHLVIESEENWKGMPAVSLEKDIARFIPFGHLRRMQKATKPLVVIFEDLIQARHGVQAAIMQILLLREVDGVKISDYVRFLSCTNRRKDRAGGYSIIDPLLGRFSGGVVELVPNINAWSKWATENSMPEELIAFMLWRPELLMPSNGGSKGELVNTRNPRTIASMGKVQDNISFPTETLQTTMFSAAAGAEIAHEYMGFLKLHKSIPNLNLVFSDPDSVETPNEASVCYAMTTALAFRSDENTIENAWKYVDRALSGEFGVVFANLVNMKNKLVQTKTFIDKLAPLLAEAISF